MQRRKIYNCGNSSSVKCLTNHMFSLIALPLLSQWFKVTYFNHLNFDVSAVKWFSVTYFNHLNFDVSVVKFMTF